jgi:hypothetical protein
MTYEAVFFIQKPFTADTEQLGCYYFNILNATIKCKSWNAAIVPPSASDDFAAEIFVSPIIDSTEAVAKLVLPLLKLAHTGNWRNAAPSVAAPLESLPTWAVDILANLGAYPHAALEIAQAPKQTTRLNKAVCYGDLMNGEQHDAYIVRISRATAANYGTPICPICSAQLVLEA